MNPDPRVVLAILAAGGAIVLAARTKDDVRGQLLLVAGFGIAQLAVAQVQKERFG